MITADALNTQKDTARAIVDRGGEYCIQVKDNQKAIHQEAVLSAKKFAPLFCPNRKSVTPMQVGFPHIQTIIKIWRTSTAYKTGEK